MLTYADRCELSSSHAAYYSIMNEELLPTLRLSVSLFLTTGPYADVC